MWAGAAGAKDFKSFAMRKFGFRALPSHAEAGFMPGYKGHIRFLTSSAIAGRSFSKATRRCLSPHEDGGGG